MSEQPHTEPDAPVDADRRADPAAKSADSGSELTTADLARPRNELGHADETEENEDGHAPLFAGDDADQFRERWRDIQSRFVDEPRRAVEQGDALVATLMQRLAETFAQERSKLESQWDREGDDFSTEDLRVALQRYRSFFDRLLSA